MSRIDPIMKNLIGTESPDDLATEILGVLTEGSNVHEAGNFYVFVYRAKTPGIAYDSHPLVAVTDVFPPLLPDEVSPIIPFICSLVYPLAFPAFIST